MHFKHSLPRKIINRENVQNRTKSLICGNEDLKMNMRENPRRRKERNKSSDT